MVTPPVSTATVCPAVSFHTAKRMRLDSPATLSCSVAFNSLQSPIVTNKGFPTLSTAAGWATAKGTSARELVHATRMERMTDAAQRLLSPYVTLACLMAFRSCLVGFTPGYQNVPSRFWRGVGKPPVSGLAGARLNARVA